MKARNSSYEMFVVFVRVKPNSASVDRSSTVNSTDKISCNFVLWETRCSLRTDWCKGMTKLVVSAGLSKELKINWGGQEWYCWWHKLGCLPGGTDEYHWRLGHGIWLPQMRQISTAYLSKHRYTMLFDAAMGQTSPIGFALCLQSAHRHGKYTVSVFRCLFSWSYSALIVITSMNNPTQTQWGLFEGFLTGKLLSL